ncbi:MAG: hypothetical protein WCG03_10875, partial [Kiritimatiellales bacterium]
MSEEQEFLFGEVPDEKKAVKKSVVKKTPVRLEEEVLDETPVSPKGQRQRLALDSDHGPLRQLVDYNFLQYAS